MIRAMVDGGPRLMLRNVLTLGLFLRLLVAVWNGYFGPSFGAKDDALGFHLAAVEYAKHAGPQGFTIGLVFSHWLGIVYSLTTDSLFLGSLLSVLTWLASALTLLGIMRLLAITQPRQFWALLIYAVLPSSVLYTAVTLREVYELLFVNLSVYAGLSIFMGRSPAHWLLLLGAVAAMGSLHPALLAFGLVLIVGAWIVPLVAKARHNSAGKNTWIVLAAVMMAAAGLLIFTHFIRRFDHGLPAAVETYRRGQLTTARTQYVDDVIIDGFSGLLLYMPGALFQYLFEPMPWRISGIADLEILFENLLRAWLIWRALAGLRLVPAPLRVSVSLVFLSYLLLETTMSSGTINWGTASRHHIPSIGLLLAAAFAAPRARRRRRKSVGRVDRAELATRGGPGLEPTG